MIRLFTTFYHENDSTRNDEYLNCIMKNIVCKGIDEIYVINESGDLSEFRTKKLIRNEIDQRPTYNDFFELINQTVADPDISIIANTDIYFDHNISLLNHLAFNDRCLALSRWDIKSDGKAVLNDRNDSQDVWIFKGRIKKVKADFCIGIPRCDNRIACELEKAGYRVENPSFSIKSYHFHTGERKEYAVENLLSFIPQPYKYIWPHNLFNLPKTLWHNLIYPQSKVFYRIDKRKINGWITIRALRKIIALYGKPNTYSKNSTNE